MKENIHYKKQQQQTKNGYGAVVFNYACRYKHSISVQEISQGILHALKKKKTLQTEMESQIKRSSSVETRILNLVHY